MKRNEVNRFAAYEPFCAEARHCFLLDLVLLAVFAVVILAVFMKTHVKYNAWNGFIWVAAAYFGIEICTNYRIAILSWIEKAGGEYITQSLILEEIREENALSGRWGSVIPNLYPAKERYGRYKVLCRGENGKRIKLRCAVNGKNWQIIADQIRNGPGWRRSVTYGRYSRVILQYNDRDDLAFILNRRLDMKPRTGRETRRKRGRGTK